MTKEELPTEANVTPSLHVQRLLNTNPVFPCHRMSMLPQAEAPHENMK